MKFDRTETYPDKAQKLPPGPWQDEPDKVQWVDEATGLDCLIVRNPVMGNLCGYVGVPEGHPEFGKGYDDVPVNVHGGLTYADGCAGPICHEPLPGRPDTVWWLGFDCAHAFDLAPGMIKHAPELARLGTYRTFDYVVSEVQSLARQLKNEH